MEFVILLPPSQSKREGGAAEPLAEAHSVTQELLAEINGADPDKLYSGRKEEAVVLNQNALSSPTMPAIRRYDGVVYQTLDYDSLKYQKYVDERVKIVSGLFGLLDAQQPVPNYKFRISKLRAYKKWKPVISEQLRGVFVIDLLAGSQRKAVSYEDGVQIHFTRMRNGNVVKAGHAGKMIKGKFVRWLAENQITTLEEIYAFSEDGYRWNGEAFHQS